MKAVIGRFEGDYAVVLIGDEEIKVDVPKQLLQKEKKEGSWLKFSFELDVVGKEQQKEQISKLLDNLKNKNRFFLIHIHSDIVYQAKLMKIVSC